MNTRLVELKRLAQAFANANCMDENGSVDEWKRRDRFDEKFAELIIQECAKFLDDNSGYDDVNGTWFLNQKNYYNILELNHEQTYSRERRISNGSRNLSGS